MWFLLRIQEALEQRLDLITCIYHEFNTNGSNFSILWYPSEFRKDTDHKLRKQENIIKR